MNLERVQELHAHALELAPDERASYLDEACAGNGDLRAEVESLLVARSTMGSFLDEPAAHAVEPKTLAAGTRIRSYEIVRILGTGGAGTVYEALQENPRRRVALKVLRSRFSSEAAQLRFRDEMSKHPLRERRTTNVRVADEEKFLGLAHFQSLRTSGSSATKAKVGSNSTVLSNFLPPRFLTSTRYSLVAMMSPVVAASLAR